MTCTDIPKMQGVATIGPTLNGINPGLEKDWDAMFFLEIGHRALRHSREEVTDDMERWSGEFDLSKLGNRWHGRFEPVKQPGELGIIETVEEGPRQRIAGQLIVTDLASSRRCRSIDQNEAVLGKSADRSFSDRME